MTLATFSAIAGALGGQQPPMTSPLFRALYGQTASPHRPRRDFPHDVTFLSDREVYKLRQAQKDLHQELWPEERIDAYLSKDILKKRAAASGFLWGRFCERPGMTILELKAWAEIEHLDSYLRGIPAWFREQHLSAKDIDAAWQTWLAPRREGYEKRHKELMAELLLMQR